MRLTLEQARTVGHTLGATTVTPVGSTAVLGHGADIDYLMLVPSNQHVHDLLTTMGYTPDSTYAAVGAKVSAYRKGDTNLILTSDATYHADYLLAGEVCALLKLAEKADRDAVHAWVRDHVWLGEARKVRVAYYLRGCTAMSAPSTGGI